MKLCAKRYEYKNYTTELATQPVTKAIRFWCLICCFFLFTSALNAQIPIVGRNHVFALPKIERLDTLPTIAVAITNAEDVPEFSVTLKVARLNYEYTFTHGGGPPGTRFIYPDPSGFTFLEEGKDEYVILVTSEEDVMVQVAVYYTEVASNHGDGMTVLAEEALGTQYFVISHNEHPFRYNSEAIVVATRDNTVIDILPTADTRTMTTGEISTITLDRGERYKIQSKEDLTGTYIGLNPELNEVCAPFAVFSGSVRSRVGPGGRPSLMMEQMFPLEVLGKTYLTVPFVETPNNYLVKVVAVEDETTVVVNGEMQSPILNSGEYLTMQLDREAKIEANQAIQVGQFYMGSSHPEAGKDAFLMMLMANEHMEVQADQFVDYLRYGDTFQVGEHAQTVIVRSEDFYSINYNTPSYQQARREFPPDPEFAYSRFFSNYGARITETNGRGYLLYLFSYAKSASYTNWGVRANSAFVDLGGLSMEILPLDNLDTQLVCPDEVLDFNPYFVGRDVLNPRYDTFEWDFGDGTEATGLHVSHQYSAPGQYTVWLRASSSISLCTDEATVSRTFTVLEKETPQLLGPSAICPNQLGVSYQVEGSPQSTYFWSVSGGALVSDTGQTVTVDWGGINADAYVAVVSESNNGCLSDTVRLPVNIHPHLEPAAPRGDTEICASDREGQVYEVSPVPGSTFTWTITGGQIISGQGTDRIVVNWDAAGALAANGTLKFKESNSTQTDTCEGESSVLEVIIYPALSLQSATSHLTCFGDSNGEASLIPNGGKGPYQLHWPDGDTGFQRTDLAAGTYELVLRDSIGCEYRSTVVIEGPEELKADVQVVPVSCHGGNDGEVYLNLNGGTAPYRISWEEGRITANEEYQQLTAGDYSARILDAHDCELLLNIEITQPERLFATSTDSPSCPGESNGSILVEASGGTPPYTYRWNTSPPQDTQLITGLPAGNYSVTVFDANGCAFTFNNEQITERIPRIFMPSAFSPNGDGYNDTFGAVVECQLTFNMQIYNQWGTLAYTTDDIYQGWDGNIKGEPAPGGKYSYIIYYSGIVNGVSINEAQRGTLRLLR